MPPSASAQALRRVGDLAANGADPQAHSLGLPREAPAGTRADPGLAVLVLARLPAHAVPWAVAQLVRGPGRLLREKGVRFARVLGSGRHGGFGLIPGLDHQGLFLMFDDVADALACVAQSPLVAAYRERAQDCLVAVLQASSARGAWGGQRMQGVVPAPGPHEPVLALTRASIRPSRALRFWRHSPPAEIALAAAPGCQLAVGLGEAPVLRQATLSLWDNAAAMNAYAREGAHQRAIEAAWRGGFFTEWMFVRFLPLLLQGRWAGRDFAEAGRPRHG
jgi:hypothetical protein